MARIGVAPTGSVVARPAQAPHVNVPGTGAAGQAVEQVGQTAMHVGEAMWDQQERLRKAAEHAEYVTKLNATKDSLFDAYDAQANGVMDGSVPKEEAEKSWGERAKELGSAGLDGIKDPLARKSAENEVAALTLRLGNKVRRAVALRDRQDVTTAIDTTLEYLQRQYNGDPTGTTERAMVMLDDMGPFSTLTPQQIQQRRQTWKEGTQYTAAYEVVNAAKNSPKLLDMAEKALQGEQFADLDPQRRAVLGNQIDAHRVRLAQQAEIAAARAQRQAEHRLRVAEAEFNTAQALADKGVFSQEYFERANKATAGTPYNAGLKAMLEQTKAVGALAARPLSTQQAVLDAIDADIRTNGISPEREKRRAQVEKVLTASRSDYDKEPLRAASERGVLTDLQPLNMTGGLPGLLGQIGVRVQQANTVSQVAGRPISPLLQAEANAIGQMLGSMAPTERANAVGMISGAIGTAQAQALAGQIDKNDRALSLAMKLGSAQTTFGLPTARILFVGQQALRDRGLKDGDKAPAKVREQIAAEIGDMLGGAVREDVLDAASLIHVGKAAEGQGLTPRKSVELALGGPIIEHAGKKLPAAHGMTTDRFRDALAGPAAADVTKQAPDAKVYSTSGGVVPVQEFIAGLPQAELMPAGLGRYYIRAGAGVALNAKREKIVIEVK